MSNRILLLEDDESLRRVLARALGTAGYEVRGTASPETALNWLRDGEGDLLLADVLLDGRNFLESLGLVRRLRPNLPVLVMSAQATASTAIDAEKGGVFEYLPKPFDLDDLVATVKTALSGRKAKPQARPASEPSGLDGQSPAMQDAFKAIARAGRSDAHVVISGEAGAGKRQAADAILMARDVDASDAIYVTPSHGAERAFAMMEGARHAVWLRLEDWTPEQQLAGLDALETTSARVIATLAPKAAGQVNPRLMARLSEFVVTLPPLRERRADMPALCDRFLREFATRDRRNQPVLSSAALDRLLTHSWPGNVAELRSVMSRVSLAARGDQIDPEQVDAAFIETIPVGNGEDEVSIQSLVAVHLDAGASRQDVVDSVDRTLFSEALARNGNNRSKAAEMLGVNRNTLARRIGELGLDNEA